MLEQLKQYGLAGIVAYGLLNTLYYIGTFLVVWFLLGAREVRCPSLLTCLVPYLIACIQ
jgi:hypothetical protein